jgi:hypothetical protein
MFIFMNKIVEQLSKPEELSTRPSPLSLFGCLSLSLFAHA